MAPILRVLLVDDEQAVRESTARMLRNRGLQVRTAATLSEARRLVEDPNLPINALVTDVVLSDERAQIEPFRTSTGAPAAWLEPSTAPESQALALAAR